MTSKEPTFEEVLKTRVLKCGHTLIAHQMMEEAKASSEIEGAKTDKTICELLRLQEETKRG